MHRDGEDVWTKGTQRVLGIVDGVVEVVSIHPMSLHGRAIGQVLEVHGSRWVSQQEMYWSTRLVVRWDAAGRIPVLVQYHSGHQGPSEACQLSPAHTEHSSSPDSTSSAWHWPEGWSDHSVRVRDCVHSRCGSVEQ